MDKTANPHDRLFKEVFSDAENAADFINGVFPVYIKSRLDLSSLTLDNNSYIDEELAEYFSDMVYSCIYNGNMRIKVTILFEHKSYPARYPMLQILKYLLKIWESCIKQN